MKATTEARINRILTCITLNKTPEARRVIIEMALREQDKETRHACAEAVAAMTPDVSCGASIALKRAHDICMNTHAI